MATQFYKAEGGKTVDLNTQFSLTDGTSYLVSCNDGPLTISEQNDGDPVPSTGLTVPRQTPLIIKPASGKTIFASTPAGGTIVVTEAP